MRPALGKAVAVTALFALVAGLSIAGASSKFAYTEAIEFPSGSLVVVFDEGAQKRFVTVDYQLTATAAATSCTTLDGVTQCISSQAFSSATINGLDPDEKGHVTATITLTREGGCGGVCDGTLHMDYTDVTLTNLTSGHVYRLDPTSGDYP